MSSETNIIHLIFVSFDWLARHFLLVNSLCRLYNDKIMIMILLFGTTKK